jgi:hypothetical protein
MAYTFDPPARRGDTFTRTLRYLEDDETTPVDLTDVIVTWSLAPIPQGLPKLRFEDDPSAFVEDALTGTIKLLLTSTQTAEFKARAYAFDVVLTFTDQTRLTILKGYLPVEQRTAEAVA